MVILKLNKINILGIETIFWKFEYSFGYGFLVPELYEPFDICEHKLSFEFVFWFGFVFGSWLICSCLTPRVILLVC